MPINTNLNTPPYFDDFAVEKQYYRVMFKPSYAVQARELTQLQSILQNQIEQFGDNIFKEGSIIKGCNFTELSDLKYVKLKNAVGFDPLSYVGFTDTVTISGQEFSRDNTFKIVGAVSGVEAEIIAATRGFETRDPDLNTFYINYTTTSAGNKVFQSGEDLEVYKISSVDRENTTEVTEELVATDIDVEVSSLSNPVGSSFGLRSAPGVIFQKGHFLFAEEQLVIVSKYTNQPDNVSIGYVVEERLISALKDPTLYDNANGSANENAPGADRLKLIPVLTTLPTSEADSDTSFFTLTRYSGGSAVVLRNVSQYNVIGEEMARRTFEESGDYIVRDLQTNVVRRNNNIKASVGSGLAYVKGYRVENLAERLLDIDPIANTATDERVNQAVSFNYGGYVNILDTGITIEDRDIILDRLGDISGAAGAASLGSNAFGQISDDNTNALLSSTAVSALTGLSDDVAGAYQTELSRTPDVFGLEFYVDLLEDGALNLSEVSADLASSDEANTGITPGFSGTGSTASGVVPLGDFSTVILKNEFSNNIGTARVRNITNDKIFLFDIRVNTLFSKVKTIHGSSGFLTVADDETAVVNESGKSEMIFDTGMISIKSVSNISIPVRDKVELSGISGNTVTISSATGENFGVDNNDILFVDGTNTKIDIADLFVDTSGDLVLNLDQEPSSTATVYLNKVIEDATPFTKATVELYVKSTFANNDVDEPSKFNLGFPDVYEIVSITDSANNDVTSSFKLKTNQKDNYYDHSYIEYIPGRPAPVSGDMDIIMNAFKLNSPTGDYFFTVESYPESVPKNKLQPYTTSSGRTYSIRDSIDFRPLVEPISGATYTNAASPGTAPTVSDSSTGVSLEPSFNASYEILTPAHNTFGQLDYEFFLNRTDAVVVDTYGKISTVRGVEAENSVSPSIFDNQIKIAEIYVPGVPALTPEEAFAQNRPQYGVKITPKGNKSYRMKDIENIEKKVDSLRYYVLLSALEAETKDINILDENGLSRFKNGIIVDPFDDLSIANLESSEFNAAIDFTEKSLMPSVKTFPLNMKYKSNSAASFYPSTADAKRASLAKDTDVSFITQPYATSFRNCVSNFYSYRGQGFLSPEFGAFPDVTVNPVNVSTDFSTPLQQSSDSIQEFIPLTSTSSEALTQGFQNVALTSVAALQTAGSTTNEQTIGDFVTNVNFRPFMAPVEVGIYMAGLRPNTQHYFFFDQVDVNDLVAPGNEVDSAQLVNRNGDFGAAVTTDANGVLRAVFSLPAETFFVGDRKMEIVDVDNYAAIDSGSTSYGFLTYRAYNIGAERASISLTTTRNVTGRSFRQDREDNGENSGFREGGDPIAQTFFIKNGMGLGSDALYTSKLDLFFKRKSAVNGVTVEIREVINGYPSYEIVPYSKIHLTPAEINVSDNASAATTVVFPSPVRLDVEKEYAFIIIPDAADPNYLIFTSQVGGTNLTPGANQGLAVVQDWGDGVLFTSTNNRAWRSYQDEDIKFTLFRNNFTASQGSVTITNDDHEFLTTENNIGRFKKSELVYKLHDSDASTSNTVGVTAGNNEISGTNLSTTYTTDDFILVNNGTNKQVFKVVSANSSIIVADRPASFTASLPGNPVTIGTLTHYDFRFPNFIILEKSSATSVRRFSTADTIYGFDSETQATITSVDNVEFSYIQPFVRRTNESVTSTSLSGTFVNPDIVTSTYTKEMKFNDKTTFGRDGMVIFSKSNDIGRTKTMDFTVEMTNGNNQTSTPIIDIDKSIAVAYQWKITNTSATTSKYISKTIELAENLDAEDFQAFVTAYRPNGTNVKVYIRPQAANDPAVFEDNNWIELEITEGLNQYSSVSNAYDFREYVYKVPARAKTRGIISYKNGIGKFEGYRRFAIKIELLSENAFKAPRLLDYRGIALT